MFALFVIQFYYYIIIFYIADILILTNSTYYLQDNALHF